MDEREGVQSRAVAAHHMVPLITVCRCHGEPPQKEKGLKRDGKTQSGKKFKFFIVLIFGELCCCCWFNTFVIAARKGIDSLSWSLGIPEKLLLKRGQ